MCEEIAHNLRERTGYQNLWICYVKLYKTQIFSRKNLIGSMNVQVIISVLIVRGGQEKTIR
jgi:hypothetical protein